MNRHHRLYCHLMSALLYCLPALASAQSPIIQEIINSVNLDSLTHTVKVLSGETGSKNQGTSDTIYSRYVSSPIHDLAADYLKRKLEGYGLSARLQPWILWLDTGTNVLAEQPGVSLPGRKYILCAHYDDLADGAYAPGADDNASGTAAVLEAARVLSSYKTAYTIVYALWDLEEGGCSGSLYYAKDAVARGDTILGVINLDMVGYDGNNDSLMEIHSSDIANSLSLADTAALVQRTYGIGVNPHIYYPMGNSQSDHRSFWQMGYGAVMLIEAVRGRDANPYGHSILDRISAFNLPYFREQAKLAAGTIALLADVQGSLGVNPQSTPPSTLRLEQNYPNPFNPSTAIRYTVPHRSHLTLTVFNTLGQQVATLVNGEVDAGYHSVEFNASNLASGVYFYRMQAGDFIQTKRLILLR